jgi:acyl transferase domain-containing protein/acyl carrier protein
VAGCGASSAPEGEAEGEAELVSEHDDLTSFADDIAIVGMAGRFPGGRDVEQFWRSIRDGRESITRFSDDDLLEAGVPEEVLRNPRYVKCAPVLEEMECFDAEFFGISPRDAAIMDPQHRHLLECAWAALEHAGHPADLFEGRIAVFAGAGAQSYFVHNVMTHRSLLDSVGPFLVQYSGNEKDVLATRVSYQLDLTGPSVTVQTACSTSLVAVHLACQSLLGGEADMALVGGVTIWVPHYVGYLYREGEIRSADGHCRPFDAAADGTTFGSGVGIVVLRPLGDALRDRDTVYGVIKGTAVNNDGRGKVGFFAPSVKGQAALVAEALSAADVDPETIGLLEAHGTGTRIGDPIEIAALTEAFRACGAKDGTCAIGSVKSNIGHLDTAAGVAGLIKVLQAMRHRMLPPSLNFTTPNPEIDFAGSPFRVNTELREWSQSQGRRRAAVNSLGIGGTNAHVIVEEGPDPPASDPSRPWQLLLLSAKNRSALERATDNLSSHIERHREQELADVSYTLQVGRSPFGERRIAVCESREDAIRVLSERDRRRTHTGTSRSDNKVVFMFTGQGAQYVDMGRQLYESERVFREVVDRCAAILTPHLKSDLRDTLYPDDRGRAEAARALAETATAQPALFAIEFALASLWRDWGIEPAALIGHSLGEYVAACQSGVFSLEDALALVALRGHLMQGMPHGSMLAVLRGEEEVRSRLSENLSIAAVNAPEVCVVSGPTPDIENLRNDLTDQEVPCRPLAVTHAFHSSMMDPMIPAFSEEVRKVRLARPTIPFVSNVSGEWITGEEALDPDYWGNRHVRQGVRFADGLSCVTREATVLLLEVGPGTALASLARRSVGRSGVSAVLASLPGAGDKTTDVQFILTSLGRVWLAGEAVDWTRFYSDESRSRVALPTYPFERVKHWLEPSNEGRVAAEPARFSTKPALQDWFYEPSWRRSLPPRPGASDGATGEPETVLVFADDCRLGDAVASRLREMRHEVVVVRPGQAAADVGRGEVTIAPGNAADMDWLVKMLLRRDRPLRYVIHMWNVTGAGAAASTETPSRTEELGFFSLLYLARAIAERNRGDALHLTIVSDGMQQVAGEPVPHPEKALLLGPTKVIPREMPNVTCRSIDVEQPEPSSWKWDRLVSSLTDEALTPNGDDVVAYRGEQRMIEVFERIRPGTARQHDSPLRDRGTYVVTGGLGGLGLVVAEYLIERTNAQVVLIGRTPVPGMRDRKQWRAEHDPDDATSQLLRTLEALEAIGGYVSVECADVGDPAQLRDAIQRARRRFGDPHGVFHLAGVLDDGLIQFSGRDRAEAVLRPKVLGTRSLMRAVAGLSLDFIVLFSSLSSVIGLEGQIDYAAANAFLNAFARHKRTLDGTRIVAIDWGMWEDVGMAADRFGRDSPDVAREGDASRGVQAAPHDLRAEARNIEVGTESHWVLDEHRRKDGTAVMPGTGYIELVRAAYSEGREWVPVELREIVFVSPMPFHGNERRNLRLELERGPGATRFAFSSRPRTPPDQDADWDLHTTGTIAEIESIRQDRCDVKKLIEECGRPASLSTRQPEHEFWTFGPRWASLKEMRFGRRQALLVLEMPAPFVEELAEHPLHPALLDMATGELVTQFDDCADLFVPFSYGSIRAYRPLEPLLYCHVRHQQESLGEAPVAAFDVTIANERGEVLVDVSEFLMRRVERAAAPFGERVSWATGTTASSRSAPGQIPTSRPELFRYGIRPAEGKEALDRILAQPGLSQVVVSPVGPTELLTSGRAGEGETVREGPGESGDEAGAAAVPEVAAASAGVHGIIRTLWQEALGVDDIGDDDDFFALGGHSLSLVQVAALLRQRFDLEVPLSDLIEQSTIANWTELVRSALNMPPGSERE